MSPDAAPRRVLLIQAPLGERQRRVFPLSLAVLAAGLARHEVRGYDPNLDDRYPQSLDAQLAGFVPDVVGISFRNLDTARSYHPRTFLTALEDLVRRVRRSRGGCVIALGGTGFSMAPEAILRRVPEVDVGFRLEADRSFPAFVDSPSLPARVPGVLYPEGAEIRSTGDAERPDGEEIRSPRFDLFPVERYGAEGDDAVGLETKRGCDQACLYCAYPVVSGRRARKKPVARIVAEVEELARRSVPGFFWVDSVFNHPAEHGAEICAALRAARLPIHWGANFAERGVDASFWRLAHEAGCRLFVFSPDGISEAATRTMRKPLPWALQRSVYRQVRALDDTAMHVSFLAGVPGEGGSDWIAFARRLAFLVLRCGCFSIGLSFIRIYPGTGIRDAAVARGMIAEDDDLLEPKYFLPSPSRWMRFAFHPAFRLATFLLRLRRAL
jgi:radical SAM superfamily enzyme YgiQ (UPF0313 family)